MTIRNLLFRALRNSLFFLLSFGGGCVFLRWVAPFPEIPQVREKLAQYAAEPRDAVFLGSSKIFRGIVPEVFDQAMQRHGLPVRSFNFGVDGMGFPESAYLFEQIARSKMPVPRWVLVELAAVRVVQPAAERRTQRQMYWHDWPRTATICRTIRLRDGRWTARPDLLLGHLELFVWRFCNRGDGASWLLRRLGIVKPANPRDAFEPAARGYAPMPAGAQLPIERYRKDLAELRAQPRKPLDAASEAALRKFAERITRVGATPIFVVPPNSTPIRSEFAATASGTTAPALLAFDDPDEFPALYQIDRRADLIHLNDRGAREFSEILAEHLAARFLPGRRQAGHEADRALR